MNSEVVRSSTGSIIAGLGGCRNDTVGGISARGEKIGVDASLGVDRGGINFSQTTLVGNDSAESMALTGFVRVLQVPLLGKVLVEIHHQDLERLVIVVVEGSHTRRHNACGDLGGAGRASAGARARGSRRGQGRSGR